MPTSQANVNLTLLLQQVSQGDKVATGDFVAAVYPELRRLAANRLRGERAQHTLQPTALVNELYLRLFGDVQIEWRNRIHFFAIAAKHIRFILIEHARRKNNQQVNHKTVSLDSEGALDDLRLSVQNNAELIQLDEALKKLEMISPRAALGIELRFFGGLKQTEIAEIQGIDVATVKRDWVFAKSWLYSMLRPGALEDD